MGIKVIITKAGDANCIVGDIMPLGKFLRFVKFVLEYGGEMPVALAK